MVKTPRASPVKKTSTIKTTNSIESKLNLPLLNNSAEKRVAARPIIGINFSNFKRNYFRTCSPLSEETEKYSIMP